MGYVTEGELVARGARLNEGMAKLAKAMTNATDVFVSYSRKDSELIAGVVQLLGQLGATPYVDQNDAMLIALTAPEMKTTLLRQRISECGRLILIRTERSITSHWTPWEVGLADGLFGVNRVATFPVRHPAGSDEWGLREYLATYPQIRKETLSGDSKPSIVVRDPSDGLHWYFHQWMQE